MESCLKKKKDNKPSFSKMKGKAWVKRDFQEQKSHLIYNTLNFINNYSCCFTADKLPYYSCLFLKKNTLVKIYDSEKQEFFKLKEQYHFFNYEL